MTNEQKHTEVVVGVCIYNEHEEVFLARCPKWENKWNVPGGHLEYGEKIEECVRRETKEETNLDVTDIRIVDVQESVFSKEYKKGEQHMILIGCCCKKTSDEIILNEELEEYKWIEPKKALETLDMPSNAKQLIRNFIKFIAK